MVIIKHWKNESKANYLASLIQSYYPSCQITVLEPSYLRTFAMAQGQLMIDFEIPS
ncbi:hypothetical protein lbkm_0263 [Lachnospiraceae bacterium KM106-2]|nr:hypothetical protein lbkm_0263 [Lachnospiraceae bacterium KM106-2]